MRIIYAGTPEFAVAPLAALAHAGHEIVLVLTQPDRPAGRGLKVVASPVKQWSAASDTPLAQPSTLKDPAIQDRLRAVLPEVMVVAAYGLILPPAVLDIPKFGAINIHASLLPRWRGAAPIQRAILAGDAETGVTIMQMDAGLDTGYMLLSKTTSISQADTTGGLQERLAQLGAAAIVETLNRLARGQLVPTPQPAHGVTYAAKIDKAEAQLDWRAGAVQLDRVVRAFNPAPIAFSRFRAETLRVLRARAEIAGGEPGAVLAIQGEGPLVACGENALRLLEVQRAGGKRMTGRDWAAGARVCVGERLGG